MNRDNTSVLSYNYSSTPGKRTVTLTAVIPRRRWNVLLPSTTEIDEKGGTYIPVDELKALATYAKVLLMQLFEDDEHVHGTHIAGHLSSLTYSFDSNSNVSLTAEMAYGFKQYDPSHIKRLPISHRYP